MSRRPGNNAKDLNPGELPQWIADAIDVPVATFFESDDDPASPLTCAAGFSPDFNATNDLEERMRYLIRSRAKWMSRMKLTRRGNSVISCVNLLQEMLASSRGDGRYEVKILQIF